ncbi:hypothetical protein PBY51_009851 [Eleginops maclovinus]|uniref:EF-hand domain-containing protein n=1 Tax=Eleginops maclovinus TaxID=56733 RepID=A0AAN7XXU0_ELEMC|nr:hypothetical protein PBY51_009851 [Eleginops maclovinus]
MPLGMKVRSSSASGRLETQHVSRTTGSGCCGGKLTDDLSKDRQQQPEWLVRELLRQNRRRHSITIGDETQIRRQHSIIYSTCKLCSLKLDETISLDNLQKLKLAFEEFERGGSRSIDAKRFGHLLKKCLGLPKTSNAQIQGLFKKIDYLGQGQISWGEFCTHMMHEYKEKQETVRRSKQVAFTLPASMKTLCHGLPIVNIHSSHDCTIVTINALETVPLTLDFGCTGPDKCCIVYGDTDGCVTIMLISSVGDTLRLWNKLPKVENMPNIAIDNAVLSPNVTFIRWKVHQDWVTQAKYFPSFHAVVSSSKEESTALVIGCVLPLTDAEQQLDEIREACYEGKTKKIQLSWTPQLRSSCDQTVFTISKGVKTFDLCPKHSLLVTGGMDRLIRMWNPHFSGKPNGILKGHSAPITYLHIFPENGQIFSVSIDCTVKIWDIQDQCCLFTADSQASGIHGDISACSYSSAVKSFYIAADCMAVLSLKIRPRLHSRLTASHDEAVMCCGYSKEFRQVVSCSEGSVVKVWDFDTGRQVFEFCGTQDQSAITCMAFDPKGRRLITGGRDGCVKIWNFNNGQCLKTLRKDGVGNEVCDCIFLQVHMSFYVMSVGGDRKIDIYPDIPEGLHHVQRPQPPWQDDLKSGHKEDILCVAQCPPSLLATSSYDGEIIVWNVVSGRIRCRIVSPLLAEHQNVEGLDKSVPSIIFFKNSKLQHFSSATALLSAGAMGCINIWNVLSGNKLAGSFKASKFQQKITKLAKTDKDTLLYAADRIGYIYVYSIEKFAAGQKSPKAENFWRAHTSRITGLQIVDNDQVVLTSSTDYTVRLWSAHGEYIGTFGQSESWSVHISSSWKHPAVPYEVLIDPLSMAHHEILNVKTCSDDIDPDKSGAHRGEHKSETHSKVRH